MGTVYRATDRLTGQMVALKRITVLAGEMDNTPGQDFRIALSNEFRALASLRHPNVITVLDYGFDAGQPYFTMELLREPQTILAAGQDTPASTRLRLLVELLQALAYLHRRGMLHRDLKPGNVLVNETGTVKVLDFGLSLMETRSRSRAQENTVGTLAYMAPELFAEEAASVASDLYAAGVIACEVLTGHHPFPQKNVAMLVNSILFSPPDLSGVDGSIEPILQRLLAKQPADRYTGVDEVIRALCAASDQPIPAETVAVRESFLQAARFVGREPELEQLKTFLNRLIVNGHRSPAVGDSEDDARGSAWLVGGESGVGKSRLLDELRIRAMVRGALVTRGQAITEGSIPYHVWRDPLRRLILAVELEDDEAAVLKTLVPDVEALLERPVLDAPALDPQMSQNRLMKVVTDVFRRLKQPTVIILEDLHWAGEENLALLRRLIPLVRELPLLLLASYRNDEGPELPDALPGIELMTLKRLDEADITELSEAMLGKIQPKIVQFLQRETEGNVFFLIEMVRVLAEQAGQLDRISDTSLHDHLLPGGIQAVVQRRLSRVPAESHALLHLAAVAGRELDVNLLRTFLPDLEAWLSTCAGAAVLEIQEDRWRFAHDKLREKLLAEMSADKLKRLHRQLAETLEQLYPDDPEQIPALAHHFQQAGIREKAIPYLTRAGHLAAASFANDNAMDFYQAAIAEIGYLTDGESPSWDWQAALIELHESLGDIQELTGQHEAARSSLQTVQTLILPDDVTGCARVQRKIGKTWENQRAYPQALQAYTDAVALLEAIPADAHPDRWPEWITAQLGRIVTYYWLNQPDDMKALADRIRPDFEARAPLPQLRMFFMDMALMGLRRDRFTVSDETFDYARSALALSDDWQDTTTDLWSRFIAGFIHLWRGHLDEAEHHMQMGLAGTERVGDVTTLSRGLAYLTMIRRKRGQVNEVRQYAERTLKVSLVGQMKEYIASAKAHQAWVALREGNIHEAQTLADEGFHLLFDARAPIRMVIAWIALFPLIASEVALGQIAEPVEHTRVLLGPTQQPLPEPVNVELQAALQAWEQNDTETTREHLTAALDLARPWGYV